MVVLVVSPVPPDVVVVIVVEVLVVSPVPPGVVVEVVVVPGEVVV